VPGTSPHSAAGSPYTISCVAGTADNYEFNVTATAVFTVNKAMLTITASSHTITFNDPVPTITPGYAGFVLGDDATDLTTQPTCSTTYTVGSLIGSYPTKCENAASGNYNFQYVDGTVTVLTACSVFNGFLSPIGGANASPIIAGPGGSILDPLRTFKLKSTIPFKFSAVCFGSPLTTGIHTLKAQKWSDGSPDGDEVIAVATDAATTGNQFRLTDSQWHFNFDTKALGNAGQGTWFFEATLFDGSKYNVWLAIKK
jgi:hypothetical protein